jgi:hypothetical protein
LLPGNFEARVCFGLSICRSSLRESVRERPNGAFFMPRQVGCEQIIELPD